MVSLFQFCHSYLQPNTTQEIYNYLIQVYFLEIVQSPLLVASISQTQLCLSTLTCQPIPHLHLLQRKSPWRKLTHIALENSHI
jgi:hypothetical protein